MGYFFALFSPFLDSCINYLDKFLLSKYKINSTVLTIYSGLFAGFTGLLIFCFTGFYKADIYSATIITISGGIGVLILLAYFKALSLDEASRVGSLFQLVPVIVLILSFIFLQERFTLRQYIGAVFIISAAFSLSLKNTKHLFSINRALWYMLLASTCSALVYVLFKTGVNDMGYWHALPFEGLGSSIGAVGILLYGSNRQLVKKQTKKLSPKVFVYLTISEIIYRVSRLSLFFALTIISASLVSVLQGLQPFMLLLLGVLFSVRYPYLIKEVITRKTLQVKIFASMSILLGLCLIFL